MELVDNKLMCQILLWLLKNKREPLHSDFGLDQETFGQVVEALIQLGYLAGAHVLRGGRDNRVQMVLLNHAEITAQGMELIFLTEGVQILEQPKSISFQ